MKTNIKLIVLVGILLFGGLTTALAATNNQKEITYYMMSFTELPGSKSFGCGEFLVPVKKKIKNPNLKKVLSEFIKAQNATSLIGGPDAGPGKPFGFPFFLVDKIQEPKKPTSANPIKIFSKE